VVRSHDQSLAACPVLSRYLSVAIISAIASGRAG
jgi:hypothetical protein